MLTLLSALLSTPAFAAESTTLPPFLRGDLSVGYAVEVEPGKLVEQDRTAARRRAIAHDVTTTARFGVFTGMALELSLPHHASQRTRFFDVQRMVYEPNLETGTTVGTDALATDPERHGKGAGGMWMRLMGTPFNEDVFASRGDQITWKLGLGYQFADQSNFWNHDASGNRGGGPASPALEIQSWWSTTNAMTQPYLGLVWTQRMSTETDLRNSSGKVVANGIEITDASTIDLTAGLEIQLHEDPDWANGLGSEVALDLYGRFGYQTAADIPSGVDLPSVISLTQNSTVTQSETSNAWAGMNVRWRIIEYVDWTTGAELGSSLPQRVEHPYDVSTSPALGWGVQTALTFRARDPLFDQ